MLDNLTPDLITNSLDEVDLDALAERSIEGLLIDLDNTLCPWHSEDVSPAREDWMSRATQRFGVCIVSNSIHPERLGRVADRFKIPFVRRWFVGRKPGPAAILEGLDELGVTPERAAMIGDQVMSDVLGGNRLGIYTIWTLPLSTREFIGTKPARLVERFLVRRFRALGLMPKDPET